MPLEQIFYISQSIAAFAIVVSLLFVGLEVRLSNRESRHRTIEELLADYREVRFQMMATADSAGIWLNGLREFAALNSVDKVRFILMANSFFDIFQTLFLHYRDGRMTGEMYRPQETILADFVAYPGMQTAWDIRRNYFQEVFRALVDDKIAVAQKRGMVPALYREEPAHVR
jgi:hypothetical protein